FTFDDLATTLISTPLHQATCGGAHLLYALTILWRADSSVPCLTPAGRGAVSKHPQQHTARALAPLAAEGYWALEWHATAGAESRGQRSSPPDTPATRLIATSHLLEWLEMLPAEIQPSPDVYRRVARWLCAALGQSSQDKSPDAFCPCVHALCAVRAL